MKKLMIAAAIVCAAVASQAASISWAIDDAFNPWNGGEEIEDEGFTAYFIANSISIDGGSSVAFTRADAIAQITSGSLAFLETYALMGDNATLANLIEWGSVTDYSVGDFAAGGASDNLVDGYLVILNPDQSYAYVTDIAGTAINSMEASDTIQFGELFATAELGNWTAVAPVPEPTSGLMLLLGMAGLALRRRRA